MHLSQDVSARINLLRFPLIVGVVLIHTFQRGRGVFFGDGTFDYHGSALSIFVQILFSEVFARTAVPLFFMISGVLFFRDFVPAWVCYQKKVSSRINTILIPYLAWNSIIIFGRYLAEYLPNSATIFSGRNQMVSTYTLKDVAADFFWSPASYQFWFLRDLFIVVLLSPIFYWFAKRVSSSLFFILLLLWFAEVPRVLFNLDWQTLVFFYLACLTTVNGWDLEKPDRRGRLTILAYLFFSMLTASIYTYLFISNQKILPVDIFAKEVILLGSLAIWCSTKYALDTKVQKIFLTLAPFSFFVYAAHEPLMTVVRKLVYRLFPPSNPVEVILYYFLLPTAVIGFLILLATIMKTLMPRFYAVMTGGRVDKKIASSTSS